MNAKIRFMRCFFYFDTQQGQSLVEIMLVIALSAVLLPALLAGLFVTHGGKSQQIQRVEAIALMKEAQEVVRNVREAGWSNIATNGTYHPAISGNAWSLVSGSETINGFVRKIDISNVYRDTNGNIVTSGGVVDLSTKQVDITLSWGQPYATSLTTKIYLSRYLNSSALAQTLQSDFAVGSKSGTIVTNTNGGEVTLGAGGGADWCNPNLSITAMDLPKNGVANAVSAIEGKVFAGTGDNASGVSFADVSINNAKPPVSQIAGTYDGFKTNDVFGETNYAYLATDTNAKEIDIMDLTQKDLNGKYAEAGYFNAPGNGTGNSVYVSGNKGYMTDGATLYTFDLSSKSGSRPQLGSISLAGIGNRVVVIGSYAYVAVGSSTTQLQIIQVSSDGKTLAVVGQVSLPALAGKNVFVNSSATRAYVVTAQSATQKEFFVLDITTKSGDRSIVGSYDTNGMDPKGVTVVPGNRAIVVGFGGEEYQVVSIANETNPIHCGGLNIDTGVNGIASILESDGDAYSYIITGDATTELKIIEGGPGGQFAMTGTFESSTLVASSEAIFHRLDVTVNRPVQTDLTFQVAIAHALNGSCNGVAYTYVGPASNPLIPDVNTSFGTATTSGTQVFSFALPEDNNGTGYENPGRCFRYKAFFSTTDASFAPIFYDASVVYSL
jgi:type II secretory pathway pseudopilin PulG